MPVTVAVLILPVRMWVPVSTVSVNVFPWLEMTVSPRRLTAASLRAMTR
jgi:hypothetical protein